MKNIVAGILSLAALAGIARADQVLIYRGALVERASNAATSAFTEFYLFDITTLEYATVVYQDVHRVKTYYATGATPFTSLPVVTTTHIPETYYAFGATTTGSNAVFQLGYFTGGDSSIALSGTSSNTPTEAARLLTFKGYYFTGNGTTSGNGSDQATVATGIFRLNIPLSIESANVGGISDAISLVTAVLDAEHYSPAP